MRVTLLLWLVVAFFVNNGFAQDPSSIRPADLIAAQAERIQQQETRHLFTLSEGRNRPDIALEAYESLTIDNEQQEALRHQAPAHLQLAIPQGRGEAVQLQLVRVDMPSFTVIESSSQAPVVVDEAIHYRGIVAGDPSSLVALSVWDGEVAALVSSSTLGGNWVLGRLPADSRGTSDPSTYLFYRDKDVFEGQAFSCGTPDSGLEYTSEDLRPVEGSRGPGDCVRIYLEVDHDIYQDKGGTNGATQYISALFNQLATLYANESVTLVLSEVFVWNTVSPYTGSTSGDMLTQFQSIRTSFNGDLGQLLSYRASGGIAVVDGLCHPYNLARLSYSGISGSFQNVPTYSWSVMVMAHEFGHLLGSQHTHACVWNGNGTAIDGCPGYTEGGCASPGAPAGGGTIMSYCHLSQVGINFNNGFGSQPGNLIRNRVLAANCLSTCNTGGGGGGSGGNGSGDDGDNDPPPSCTEQQLFVRVKLDTYTPETSWQLKNEQGAIIAQGGSYPKTRAGETVVDTLCLPQGCYSFKIMDSYGDGICCDYGDGMYLLIDGEQQVIADGGEFPFTEEMDFCLPYDPSDGDDCASINFNAYNILSYGTNQDAGSYAVEDDGHTLYIENNAWKAIAMDYEVTANTVIAFDFKSTRQGEIHGLGFDNNDNISFAYTFRVYGYQNWGLPQFDTYHSPGAWQDFTIPIGQFYTGTFDRLFLVSDHDGGARNGNSWFRNLRIYEGEDCQSGIGEEDTSAALPTPAGRMQLFPNPVTYDRLTVTVDTPIEGEAVLSILSLTGQVVEQQTISTLQGRTQQTLDTSALPAGAYVLRWRDESGEHSQRFTVQ